MKAAVFHTFDGPGSIVIEEIEEPHPGTGEVVIDVGAAALNFFDILASRNKYQLTPPLPYSPGAEIAGRIAACGRDVQDHNIGDRVLAFVRWNGCRQRTTAQASRLIAIPEAVSDEVAASVTVTYGTACHALKDRGRLRPGETLAVLGASGGAGLAAIEVGKKMGAHIIAVASSREKLALCTAHGADDILDYERKDLKAGLKELTKDRGVDVIYDCVGGPFSEPALRAMAWGGRFLVVGFASGEIAKIPLNLLLLKGCEMSGVFWTAFMDRAPEAHRANICDVLSWCAAGDLTPHIEARFPLERIKEALTLIEERRVKGKIVISPGL